jgi:hypothetical protein
LDRIEIAKSGFGQAVEGDKGIGPLALMILKGLFSQGGSRNAW